MRSAGNGYADTNGARFSISNPELTSMQVKQMFPDLSEHWRHWLSAATVTAQASRAPAQSIRTKIAPTTATATDNAIIL
ncbi:hypothetical protein ANCDUO_01525 [Ancylostoma duodenale]|uniref:Uncharacterized protein n=1 Tax=Ancylostoma duodenale TaxID=51022 RepID=A0A0C2DYP1_9BILA|nr:hypothetical protein ANCDUO_01525 [Ancylostoma duodenale]